MDENEELVRAVYAELAELRPTGFRYSTVRLEDGVTFIHTAIVDSGKAPLPELASFRRFLGEIEDRCDEPPVVSESTLVGSYSPEG